MADDLKHTPGPWKVYQSDVRPVLEYGGDGNDHYAICQCFGPDAHFNQRLIAAAPDLLKALTEAARWFEEYAHGHFDKSLSARKSADREIYADKACRNAERATLLRAAIAKATGGSDG